jgi:hypothetical protein
MPSSLPHSWAAGRGLQARRGRQLRLFTSRRHTEHIDAIQMSELVTASLTHLVSICIMTDINSASSSLGVPALYLLRGTVSDL